MLLQSLVNGLAAGSAYALVALGFGVIFQVCGFFHFAHGAIYAAAVYTVYALHVLYGWNAWFAVPIGIVGAAVLGGTTEIFVYRHLRRCGASPIAFLIASLGIFIVLQNCISLGFGDATVRLYGGGAVEGINIVGARVTPIQMLTIIVSALLSLCVWGWLRYAKSGKTLRAVASDRELSVVVGIQSERVIVLAFAMGSALAAVAAILIGYDTDLSPMMGFRALLMGVVAMIVGGIGSIPGYLYGGLFVGLAQHLGVWKLPTQWQDAIVFLILILFLLFRPQGFCGKPIRGAEV